MLGTQRFCSTKNGRLACMPVNAEVGDDICIFFGGRVPYAIRPIGGGLYRFIGQCYVNGIMDGEALDIKGLKSPRICSVLAGPGMKSCTSQGLEFQVGSTPGG